MGNALIRFDNVTLRVGGAPCFAGMNWTIEEGAHWGIVGPNGAGKTILADAIAGRVQVVAGKLSHPFASGHTILERQRNLNQAIRVISLGAQRDLLGGVQSFYQARWQSLGWRGAVTVRELLSAERLAGNNPYLVVTQPVDREAHARHRQAVVDLLAIEPLLDRRVQVLSNGESRKVLLARALLQRPRILIMDNPFCGLDVDYRAHLAELLPSLMDQLTLIVLGGHPTSCPKALPTCCNWKTARCSTRVPSNRLAGTSANSARPSMWTDYPPHPLHPTRSSSSGT